MIFVFFIPQEKEHLRKHALQPIQPIVDFYGLLQHTFTSLIDTKYQLTFVFFCACVNYCALFKINGGKNTLAKFNSRNNDWFRIQANLNGKLCR